MSKTIAQELERRGERREAIRSRQETLVRQLAKRFGKLDGATIRTIESTKDVDQLDTWLDRVVTAATLDEVGIVPT